MAGRIVTVARFDQAGQAHVARNALEAAGIKSVITDEAVVSMDWFLSNAVGGIKVQVLEEDAERALAALNQALGEEEPLDDEAMAAEAEAAGREDDEDAAPTAPSEPQHLTKPWDAKPPEPVAAPAPPEKEGAPSERDEYARRFFFTAFFSLALWPLWFYAVYLLFNAAFGEGPISSRAKRRLGFGVVVLGLCSFVTYTLIAMLVAIATS